MELLVTARSRLREEKRRQEADRLRSGLESSGVSPRDTLSGTEWTLETVSASISRFLDQHAVRTSAR